MMTVKQVPNLNVFCNLTGMRALSSVGYGSGGGGGFGGMPSYGMEEAYGAGGYGGGGAAMRGSRGGSFGGMAPRGGPRSGYGGGGFGEDEWGGGGFVGGGRGSFGGGEGHSLAFSDAAGGGSMESTQVSNSDHIGITGSCECEIKHF